MANKPIRIITLRQIIRLYCQGEGIRTISNLTGASRNTIRKYIRIWDGLGMSLEEFRAAGDVELRRRFYAKPK